MGLSIKDSCMIIHSVVFTIYPRILIAKDWSLLQLASQLEPTDVQRDCGFPQSLLVFNSLTLNPGNCYLSLIDRVPHTYYEWLIKWEEALVCMGICLAHINYPWIIAAGYLGFYLLLKTSVGYQHSLNWYFIFKKPIWRHQDCNTKWLWISHVNLFDLYWK